MSTNVSLGASLPNAVLKQSSDVFYTDDIFEAITEHEQGQVNLKAEDALPKIQQYLNELVRSGVLWQSGDGYFFRIRPRVPASTVDHFTSTAETSYVHA